MSKKPQPQTTAAAQPRPAGQPVFAPNRLILTPAELALEYARLRFAWLLENDPGVLAHGLGEGDEQMAQQLKATGEQGGLRFRYAQEREGMTAAQADQHVIETVVAPADADPPEYPEGAMADLRKRVLLFVRSKAGAIYADVVPDAAGQPKQAAGERSKES